MYRTVQHLQGKAQAIVVTTPLRDQAQVLVVEEEEALQLRPRRFLGAPWIAWVKRSRSSAYGQPLYR